MKNIPIVFFLVFSIFSCAQQSSNSIFNYEKSADDLVSPNDLNLSLNMNSFKLPDFKQNTNPFYKLTRKVNKQNEQPSDGMPIFVPEGMFFLEIHEVNEDIDYKLRIFDMEKSDHFEGSTG